MFSLHIVHNPSKKLRATIKQAFDHHRKFSHTRVKYQQAPKGHENRCANCMSYRGRDECVKVQAPISPDGWCIVGHSRKDGHAFDKRGEKLEHGSE